MIATAADDNYALPLAVMLRSLAEHLPSNFAADVFILSSGLADSTIQLVRKACLGFQVNLRQMIVLPATLSDLKVSHHISVTTYYRLLLESVLPNVNKVVYLD